MTDLDRYYISEISGYPLFRDGHDVAKAPTTSYSVLDRYACHREVVTIYADDPGTPRQRRLAKALAEVECATLNRLDREDLAA